MDVRASGEAGRWQLDSGREHSERVNGNGAHVAPETATRERKKKVSERGTPPSIAPKATISHSTNSALSYLLYLHELGLPSQSRTKNPSVTRLPSNAKKGPFVLAADTM